MQLTVRKGALKDAQLLAQFNQKMALETEGKTLQSQTILRGVQKVVEEKVPGFYLLCECSDGIAGALMIQTEWSDWRDGYFWWIHSVYVDPAMRRRGVYQALIRGVEDEAIKCEKQNSIRIYGYRLYVEKQNHSAQQVYLKQGMFKCEYDMYEQKR